jgi:hypothetical protein
MTGPSTDSYWYQAPCGLLARLLRAYIEKLALISNSDVLSQEKRDSYLCNFNIFFHHIIIYMLIDLMYKFCVVGFEVFTAATMKNAVFWGVAPCRCDRLNRHFGGSYRLHLQGRSAATCSRWFFARGFFYPEDGGDTILRNVGSIDHIYTAPHPRRRHSS